MEGYGWKRKAWARGAPSLWSCRWGKTIKILHMAETSGHKLNCRKEEVELKVRISPSRAKIIRKRLAFMGAKGKGGVAESDTYFTAPHRDFIKSRECLRIREKNNFLELTYKGRTTGTMARKKQFWKKEINIPIRCRRKLAEDFLLNLNFRKVADVIKKREIFLLGNTVIALDNIRNLGWFIEIESSASGREDRKKALRGNLDILKKLGLEDKDIINEPYRDLVIKKK